MHHFNQSAMDFLCVFMTMEQICDLVASLISPAWAEPKGISLLFSAFLFNSLHTIHSRWFHSAPSHFPPTTILFPLPFLTFLHSPSLTFFPSSILPQYVWVPVSISIYVSLFGINLRTVSWSPNFFFRSLSLYLIISLCTRLNSYMRG